MASSHGHGILASFPNLKNDLVTIKDSRYRLSTLPQRNLYWKVFTRNLRRRLHFYLATCSMHWLNHLRSRCRKALDLEEIAFDVINPSFTLEAPSNLSVFKRLQTVCFDFTTLPERALREMMEALLNTSTSNLLKIYPTCAWQPPPTWIIYYINGRRVSYCSR